jgi:hypothetical protein
LRLLVSSRVPPAYGKNNSRGGLANWSELHDITPEMIVMWGRQWPDAINTGILTKFTPAFDIDILTPEAAEAVEMLARERFEERGDMHRHGHRCEWEPNQFCGLIRF